MFLSERLVKIIDYRYPRRAAFSALERDTGITQAAWRHIYNGRNHPSAETLEALCKLFPEYTLWLMTGMANEGSGQTSPDIEQLRELEQRVAGSGATVQAVRR